MVVAEVAVLARNSFHMSIFHMPERIFFNFVHQTAKLSGGQIGQNGLCTKRPTTLVHKTADAALARDASQEIYLFATMSLLAICEGKG